MQTNRKKIIILDKFGNKRYYKNINKRYIFHNKYGCAFQSKKNNYREYHINGKLHNLLGPSMLDSNGRFVYFINNIFYSKRQFYDYLEIEEEREHENINI